MRSKIYIFIVLIMAIFLSSIGLYAGHFLFSEKEELQEASKKEQKQPPVSYKHMSMEFKGIKQDVNMLEVDLSSGGAIIKPVLSFDSIFGFEKLSSIASRVNAYAAVNAGFFYEYGRPSGMVCIDGKLITKATGTYPVFGISNKKAQLSQIKTEIYITSGEKNMTLDSINTPGISSKSILYTPEYGRTNRVKGSNLTITIQNNTISSISEVNGSSNIPKDGMLVTIIGKEWANVDMIPFSIGEKVEFGYKSDMGEMDQAYECGSWIIRDGKIVIQNRDAWVGVLTNRDPRTAVGIKGDGKVLLVTVDGRQPGFSAGMTGKELGEFLLSYGVRDAAMLDGGASTTMIVNRKIVNRPSYKGEERPLGGGLVIQLTEDN